MHATMNKTTLSHLYIDFLFAPSVNSPAKKAQVISHSYAQNEAQKDYPVRGNFLTTGSCFERSTFCVKALCWLENKKKDEQFWFVILK